MAAAGLAACAVPFSIGDPISPDAALRSSPSPTGSPRNPRHFPKRCTMCSPACNSSAARPVLLASTRRASVCSAPRRARTLRRSRRSAARNLPAHIRAIHLQASTPVSKRWLASMASTISLRCGPPFRCRTGNSDNKVEKFVGAPPMANRQLYFDASPISYATYANNGIGVLLATGTQDDLVDPKTQTEPFQLALKQAGFFLRPCIVPGAPHYWMNDPIEETGSLSGFLAPRLMRFLTEKL